MIISLELIKIIRAVLFGATIVWAGVYFVLYFKSIFEDIGGGGYASIQIDLWWWTGLSVSIILGILVALIMISL